MRWRWTSPKRNGRTTTAIPLRRARRASPLLLGGLVLALCGGGFLALPVAADPSVHVGVLPASDVGHGQVVGYAGPGPRTVSVPALGIHAAVAPVRPTRGGELGVPSSFTDVGWWGGSPGAVSAAPVVLVGHVDDKHGPAVFYRLRQTRPGSVVTVTTASGVKIDYVVDAVRQYADDDFPAETVYGATARPTLRLITCGGFSWLRRHYEDNVVVYAHGT